MSVADQVLQGNMQAAARLITGLEAESPDAFRELDLLYSHTGKAHIVGITGAPGIGKSTLTSSLVGVFRAKQMTVGVLAVDPSSPFTGGAILGDRIRMQEHSSDHGVFIRSIASRGCLGGLAKVVSSAIHVLDAMGKEIILVETVGTGQSEIDANTVADTVVLVLSSESGDSVQMMKAGIMEIADVFVVNKADRGGAQAMSAEIRAMLAIRSIPPNIWKPRVLLTEATTGKGVQELGDEILKHRAYLTENSKLVTKRHAHAKQELLNNLEYVFQEYFEQGANPGGALEEILEQFADKKISPHVATQKILELFITRYANGHDESS